MTSSGEGIHLTEAVPRRNVSTFATITAAEVLTTAAELSRLIEERKNSPVKIASAVFRGASRLLHPSLNRNVELSGEGCLVGDVSMEDYQVALDTIKGRLESNKSFEEIARFHKFYVEKSVVGGRELIVCSCAPRGVMGALRSGGAFANEGNEKPVEHLFTKEKKRDTAQLLKEKRFYSAEQIAQVYSQVESGRQSRIVDDENKPIVVIQGLHPSFLGDLSSIDTRHLGSQSENSKVHSVFISFVDDKSSLAHELAHTFHQGEPWFKPALLTEGDAQLAEQEVCPDQFDENLVRSLGRSIRQQFSSSEIIGEFIKREVKLPYSEQDYQRNSLMGYLLAQKVIAEHGREFWDRFLKTICLSQSNANDFFNHTDLEYEDGSSKITAADCYRMIAEALKEC